MSDEQGNTENLLPIKITRDKVLIDGKDIGMVHSLKYSDGPGPMTGQLTVDVYNLMRDIEIELEARVGINKIHLPDEIKELVAISVWRIHNSLTVLNDLDLATKLVTMLNDRMKDWGWLPEQGDLVGKAANIGWGG